MSWLNFNDSLNSIKGQISNFASNVLAEDEGHEVTETEYRKLKDLCQQQEVEIQTLRLLTEELKSRRKHPQDGRNGSWDWDSNEESHPKAQNESISTLKANISLLKTEKAELFKQLEQLDADNQENLLNIMRMKEKLQFELNDLSEKYLNVKEENDILLSKVEELNEKLSILKEKSDSTDGDKDDEYIVICRNLTESNQRLNHEMDELKKELFVIKSSNETFKKIIEESKAGGDGPEGITKKLEGENKLLYSELKKANQQLQIFEKKSLEDEENCQKLALILEAYEKQVSTLKEEVQNLSVKQTDQKQIDDLEMENENLHKSLKFSEEETNRLKSLYNEQIKNLTKEIESLKIINDELLIKSSGRMDIDLEEELGNIREEHEIQINILREELEQLKNQESEKEENKLEEKENLHEIQLNSLKEEMNNSNQEKEKLKTEIETLRKQNENLLVAASGRMDIDLEDELETIQQEHEIQINVLREELEQLKNRESENEADETKYQELEEQKLEVQRELDDLQEQYGYIQENHKVSLQELHNKYINIITENIKKFQECEKPSDFDHHENEEDPQVSELRKHVENIMKILLDLKYKCATLEKRILEISDEKKNILLDKNHEIEKLIRNSDMLSQEIVSKNQTIKDYENECNEISKNNELLINELETYKNNPVLQTISESNEDNMILLESQLENANKRIEDLEKIIDDLEKQNQQQPQQEDEIDLENCMKQLNMTETEIDNKKKDYDELLNSFDQLQIHYESLKKELDETKEDLTYSNEENSRLQSTTEKLRADYETLEYQVSELNINSEGLQEETQEFKIKFKAILAENSNLKQQFEEDKKKTLNFEAENNALLEKLSAVEEINRNLESQIETLTEKLKSFKMTETTLKLQYEQKSKELAIQSEARYNLEVSLNKMNADLAQFQHNFVELQTQNDKLQSEYEELKDIASKKDERVEELENSLKELESTIKTFTVTSTENNEKADYANLKLTLDETVLEKANLQAELSKLGQIQTQLKEATERAALAHQQLQEVTNSRNELINMVTMKHQENVTYHNEIQRLNQILTAEVEKCRNLEKQQSNEDIEVKNKEIEKLTDQNNFLKEKCEVIAKNLLEEQSKVQQLLGERSEKESTLQKKLDRLQTHLIELEEHYTEELYQAEQKNSSLRSRISELEDREKSSNTMYTSVSIRANQQVESLQSQLQTVVQERESLRKQISDADDQNTKQAAALANLQFVLEQFRKDKEKDVMKETERIRRHIQTEKQVQEELRTEISNLKSQLEERNQGLLAASRLSDQLESSKRTISGLKDEVSQLQTKLTKAEEDLKDTLSTTDGKVDKVLIKNLILGFVTSNNIMNRDQTQILKIISTVLDFNQQDHDKVKLNKPQQGWLASFLAPQADTQNKMSEESLSRAFIKFLENESKPRVVPSLLNNVAPSESSSTRTTSRSTTPGQTPIVLSEIVLPTFSDFAQNRNSSSILKDVLKDNS